MTYPGPWNTPDWPPDTSERPTLRVIPEGWGVRVCDSDQVEIGILGPLEVRAGGRAVPITGTRLRALITRLALDAPAVVSTDALVSAVWPGDPPADPINALQSLISRVRKATGEATVVQQVPGGYRLAVDRTDVDAALFEELMVAGRRELRAGELAQARTTFSRALAMWRGTALADAGDASYAVAPATRLTELQREARADLIEAELGLGRAVDVLTDVEALAVANPLRERFTALLIRALVATGRTAEALAAYQRLREQLADELGVDPGAELQELHLAVLRGETPSGDAVLAVVDDAQDRVPAPRRSNLRAALTSFIGREDEVMRVSTLLGPARLVTVVGPGGAGKTRLATEIARQWLPRRSDGVWMVELAPVSDEAGLAQAMLGALGQLDTRAVDRRADRQVRPSTEQLLDVLSDSDCLLVVDNCEHLIGPIAALVDQVLARCPDVLIVATSREPLAIGGEALCVLPPLGLPPDGVAAEEAIGYQSVRLFVDRAQAVSAEFILDAGTVGAVCDIVRRLDGLPLAIELAAAKLRVMPVAEIATRLSDRFRLLTGGSRTAMPRHRTLRAVVEWSWDLLAPDERLLIERLAVFPAGATRASAVAVCADERLPAEDVGDLLLSLVDKSLLVTIAGRPTRYRMLETIREYGIDRLTERGEATAARTAHARHFAAVTEQADPVLRQAGQLTAIATLVAERDNILAGLGFLAESDDPADRAASLDVALSLTWYWTMIGANSDASEWLGRALAATDGMDHPGRVWAQAGRAVTSMFDGAADITDVPKLQGELVAFAGKLRTAGPPPISSLSVLVPMLAYFGGDIPTAEASMEQILRSPDRWLRGAARVNRVWFAENEGDTASMRADVDAAYDDFDRIGDRWGLSSVLSARATLRAQDGDIAGAIADNELAWKLAAELGSTDDTLLVQVRLAGLYLRAGEVTTARRIVEGVKEQFAGHSQGVERGMFVDGVLLGAELVGGDLAAASALAAELRERLASHPPGMLLSHAAAVVGATTAAVAIRCGDIELASADLVDSYPKAVVTGDMPIIAAVGVSVAGLASAIGRPADAAEILGAAARLRGSIDRSDPLIAELTEHLRAVLGDGFDAAFDSGRALDRPSAIGRIDPAPLVRQT